MLVEHSKHSVSVKTSLTIVRVLQSVSTPLRVTDPSHDLSWGTKGADATEATDLGAVKGIGNQVEVELVSEQRDIDIAYQDALDNIRLKRANVDADELPPKKEMSEQQQKDIYVRHRAQICNELRPG